MCEMANMFFAIKASTLRKIADAIRAKRGISGNIPVIKLGKALLGIPIAEAEVETFPAATLERYIITKQTLTDVADAIRKLDGSTENIEVEDLEAKILNLVISDDSTGVTTAILGRAILGFAVLGSKIALPKLTTPVIYLATETENEGRSTAILGGAILGLAILGSRESLPKLETPSIHIAVNHKLTTPVIHLEVIQKLDTPIIKLEVIEEMQKLATPIISLVVIDDGGEEPDIPDIPELVKLGTPIIRLEIVEDEIPNEPDEPEIIKLDTPVIYLDIIEDEIPEEPIIEKLDTPVIELVEVSDEPAEIVLFEGDVVTKSSAINGGTWGTKATILTTEHLLEFNTLGYTVAINGSEYVLDTKLMGDDNDGVFENSSVVRIYQGWEGTGIQSNLLGAEGTVNHIKIYYREGDLYPAETVSTYGLRRDTSELSVWCATL